MPCANISTQSNHIWFANCVFWNVFTIICTCFECWVTTGKFAYGRLHVWLHMQRLKRIVVIWQNQCLGIARKGVDTRSRNNGVAHCRMHTGTGLSMQQRRQMWKFLFQLCSDNTSDIFSKKEWRSNPMKHTCDISADVCAKHICGKYVISCHTSHFASFWTFVYLSLNIKIL